MGYHQKTAWMQILGFISLCGSHGIDLAVELISEFIGRLKWRLGV